ncbi:hypothetical protein PMPD1_1361 [Paramixta manurensis]|uniref:Uncharacterized protein n=1 Tax=Paramixta manurensis TaxID=2740817 RepID=A0A6M8UF23_9GAMM|nr:hypothetical protein PMPD1_1361 [Erwiniaceae bacterium PD-1]
MMRTGSISIPGAFPSTPAPSEHEVEQEHDLPPRRESAETVRSGETHHSGETEHTEETRHSSETGRTQGTFQSAMSRTSLEVRQQQEREQRIHDSMHTFFSALGNPNEHPNLELLIADRTERLMARGESAADIAETFSKAKPMDRVTDIVEGAIRAFSFGISGLPADALSQIGDVGKNALSNFLTGWAVSADTYAGKAAIGVIGGVTAMTLRAVSDGLLNKPLEDALWLGENASKLEASVKPLFEAKKTVGSEMLNAVKGGVGYDIRNVVNSFPAMADLKGLNTGLNIGGSMAGGSISSLVQHHGQRLPVNLLARTDWEDRYFELKNASLPKQMVVGGIQRSGAVVQSLASFEGWRTGRQNAMSDNMLAEIATLGIGLGGVNMLRKFAADAMGSDQWSAAGRIFADQMVNTVGAAAAYATQGLVGVVVKMGSEAIDHAVGGMIQGGTNALAQLAGNRFREQIENEMELGRLGRERT